MATNCPPPPRIADLPALDSAEVLETEDLRVVRIYRAGGAHPVGWDAMRAFGPVAGMRFDHQPPPPGEHATRAVYYGSTDWTPAGFRDPLPTALAEAFRTRYADLTALSLHLTSWTPTRPLRLLLLSDSDWLPRAGGNAALTAGATGRSQRWSGQIYAAYPQLDGLCWSSSPRPAGRNIALFRRVRDAFPPRPALNTALNHPGLTTIVAAAAHQVGIAILS